MARLLDLFCGAGGAAMGYHRAGFDEIVGVDIKPQKRYPFEFIPGDALEYVAAHCQEFDAIHASPPCQAYSVTKSLYNSQECVNLLPETRQLLAASGVPWVIENVVGAPFQHWIQLCGAMFGLRVYRHRRFECSHLILQPHHPKHIERCVTGRWEVNWSGFHTVTGGGNTPLSEMKKAMGIDWMTGPELAQSIPPPYTEYLGRELIKYI